MSDLYPGNKINREYKSKKSSIAYRTIREVASELNLEQHVLRFWENKFPQINPLKRAGGRRYYRPEDIELLKVIKTHLYTEGYTIKGVQRLFKSNKKLKSRLPRTEVEQKLIDPNNKEQDLEKKLEALLYVLEDIKKLTT